MSVGVHIQSPNKYSGFQYKKFSSKECKSTSLDSHPHRVSCRYGVSTKIWEERGAYIQSTLPKPPFEDLDLILVGKGEKGEECGWIYASHVCTDLECGKPHYMRQRCERRTCPDCYYEWLQTQKSEMIGRLLSKEAKEANRGKRLVEIVLSPDQKMLPERRCEFNLLLKEGYEYIKEKGARGGCVIVHPFRATDEAKRLAKEAKRKTWEWIREQPNHEAYYYYSLHFHLLTYVDKLKPPEKGELWVYKTRTEGGRKKGRRKKGGRVVDFIKKSDGEEALGGLIRYLLTHAGTLRKGDKKFSSVRWFGTCSYNKFKATGEERKMKERGEGEELRCKVCGSMLRPFWKWVKEDYGIIKMYIEKGEIKEPKYWSEIEYVLEKGEPPPGAEKYIVKEERRRKR